MAILGDDDWSHSTTLSRFVSHDERTEIKVTSHGEYVVVLELTAAAFQEKLRCVIRALYRR
jgi:hypothetical protein